MFYAFLEITVLLARYWWHLLFYKRFINNRMGGFDNPGEWEQFCADGIDFDILKWMVLQGRQGVHYGLKTPMRINLHLYTPQAAHLLGLGKAMIYGPLSGYTLLNMRPARSANYLRV